MKNQTLRALKAVSVPLITTLLLAGCGKDDSVDDTSTTDTATTDTATTDTATTLTDNDLDGVLSDADCDDLDDTLGDMANDADCDGALTAEDCDDNDPNVGLKSNDADCDGYVTAVDCDDNDSLSTAKTTDRDCDGAHYRIIGENSTDHAGRAVANAGDVDGDGLDDILIGAPDSDDQVCGGDVAGEAYIVLGSSLGSQTDIRLANADYTFYPNSEYQAVGSSVSSAGDVDGDGLDDILIGAPMTSINEYADGVTYLVLGSQLTTNSEFDLSNAQYIFTGENVVDYSGARVASAGDVDGDGLDDIMIASYYDDTNASQAGAAYLILGSNLGASGTYSLSSASYKFVGENESDTFGHIASAGDVDGDGLDDIIVSAQNYPSGDALGKSYLFFGSSLTQTGLVSLTDADYTFTGVNSIDVAGYNIDSFGDLDSDGRDDLIISAPGVDHNGASAGAIYIVLASQLGTTVDIELNTAAYAVLGNTSHPIYHAVNAGDTDGDGLDDLLIGSPYDETNVQGAGKAYLISSADILTAQSFYVNDLPHRSYTGIWDSGNAGSSIAGGGDFDGNGLSDVIIGEWRASTFRPEAGTSYLIMGGI